MEKTQRKKHHPKSKALALLRRYCAYQERCHREVRSKLLELGIYGHDLEDIIATLIEDNFLNEERFARSFARGKFRFKQWGKKRIIRELQLRDISDYYIRKAMEEIEESEYRECLRNLLEKKASALDERDAFARKSHLVKFVILRGFEAELAWEMVNQLPEN
jgi:regulatory protein